MAFSSFSSSSSPFPSDIIFEILTRTNSLKTLDTCKAVSKEWHNMVFESNFMPQFCEKSKTISGFFVQSLSKTKYVTEFISLSGCSGETPLYLPVENIKPENIFKNDIDMKIEASSKQGILCCVRSTRKEYRYHICKPSTKQWIKLPNPRIRYSTIKVALIVLRSNPLQFKIIRLSSPRTLYHHYRKLGLNYYLCEIFDSEAWVWREAKDLLLPPEVYFDMFAPAVNASGLVYFKLRKDDQVMALNYNGEEAFSRFSLPKPALEYKDYGYNQLVEYKGKLGFTCLSPKGMELWVFENGNQSWELKKEVDIEILKKVTNYPSSIGFYNADIALMKDYYEVIFYKLQDKSFNVVKLDKCHKVDEIFPFRSDLEPLDLRMQDATNTVSATKYFYPFSISLLLIVFVFLFGTLFSYT
ncbi:F-box protein At5g49610-like [Nicotiana tabacum]|uniref:F-box protein At5g49610-like n=2 Tax=Nicotiana TaxID=4085 RepID=A0A1S3XIY3_TOBAC|nr:PREDICTED: uncharacterized protein LOC104247140 [Nicotiana sylvestris]XP_016439930.1 PREDICTED: uncharacterized protein LOC107765759 [Nicotiana tabacum]